jgi:hypothetical protein
MMKFAVLRQVVKKYLLCLKVFIIISEYCTEPFSRILPFLTHVPFRTRKMYQILPSAKLLIKLLSNIKRRQTILMLPTVNLYAEGFREVLTSVYISTVSRLLCA